MKPLELIFIYFLLFFFLCVCICVCVCVSLESVGACLTVGSSVGHRQGARTFVLEFEVLIFELVAIDGLATSAIVVGKVTTLK